ncbi:MAG: hypothetical protein JWO42_270 [Chloroflexi bacterium]|nr:hypothetical protein [Chloroflexota bacterium]
MAALERDRRRPITFESASQRDVLPPQKVRQQYPLHASGRAFLPGGKLIKLRLSGEHNVHVPPPAAMGVQLTSAPCDCYTRPGVEARISITLAGQTGER